MALIRGCQGGSRTVRQIALRALLSIRGRDETRTHGSANVAARSVTRSQISLSLSLSLSSFLSLRHFDHSFHRFDSLHIRVSLIRLVKRRDTFRC